MAEQAQQWWGALTQQFQHIAQQVPQDPAQKNAMAGSGQHTPAIHQKLPRTASDMMRA